MGIYDSVHSDSQIDTDDAVAVGLLSSTSSPMVPLSPPSLVKLYDGP
jgi:hypothetical protein